MNTMAPHSAAPALFLLIPIFLILIAFAVAVTAFWIWMIVDCAMKENAGNDKIVWLLVIIFLGLIGALIYFFARRSSRPKTTVTPPVAPPPRV